MALRALDCDVVFKINHLLPRAVARPFRRAVKDGSSSANRGVTLANGMARVYPFVPVVFAQDNGELGLLLSVSAFIEPPLGQRFRQQDINCIIIT